MAQQASFSTDGIKKLLDAEHESQKIVTEARKLKTERLRQAKAEAEREIAAYRAEREGAYQKKISDNDSGSAATKQRMLADTNAAIKKVQDDVKHKKQQVLSLLLDYVTYVQFK